MKKVININFQGRVIPIEESAYDELKQYVESLRRFFANEEGKDEIINDIEGRIAELFGEILKKGSTCISDEDVAGIIASMGRPEDFEGEENKVQSQLGGNSGSQQQSHSKSSSSFEGFQTRDRVHRNEADKFLGGVCSGLAAYFRIDPSIVRLIFVLFMFSGGAGFLLYILLWIILPAKALQPVASTRRLYRNPDEKVVAGVAGGIATYFDIPVWVPRLVFAFPLVIGIISSFFRSAMWFDIDPFPSFVFGSFGGTLFVVYAVLWAVIPEAKSASEKLEMRGEKVDLNSIKNTIQEDLEGFKTRTEKWGNEFSEKAKNFSQDFSQTAQQKSKQFGNEMKFATKNSGSKLANAIGILFKAFFLFIAGIIAFALMIALLAMLVTSVGVFPLKDFILEGFWQNFLAWSTLFLFLFVPVVGIIIWLIRRIIGAKAGSRALGFTFGGLWTLGWISATFLVAMVAQNFDARARDKQELALVQPKNNKLYFKVADSKVRVVGRWLKLDGLLSYDNDSLVLNNINLRIVKSPDSAYHLQYVKYSSGSDEAAALRNMEEIRYSINQNDSLVYLDRGFNLRRGTRFRNQGVELILQVPVGKKIELDPTVFRRLNYFNVHTDRHDFSWDDDPFTGDFRGLSSNTEYVMTIGGLERTGKKSSDWDNNDEEGNNSKEQKIDEFKKSKEELEKEYQRKLKEAEELKKALDKPVDTTPRYKYQKISYQLPQGGAGKRLDKGLENDQPELGRNSLLYFQS